MFDKKRTLGQYNTTCNPFQHKCFEKWIEKIPNIEEKLFLEPFCGTNNLIFLLQDFYPSIRNWSCYDIDIQKENNTPQYPIIQQDTILNFPLGYDVIVTNPPYLSKNSATRRNLYYPNTEYDDIYKLCLDLMLKNCDYVAAIIPESFITSGLFHSRIYSIISLTTKCFTDTECPVCLALFTPHKLNKSFVIYHGDDFVGYFYRLKHFDIFPIKTDIEWKFNDPIGSIGVKCVDSNKKADIHFHNGELINPQKIKVSSRSFTRISGLPEEIHFNDFIKKCNIVLETYREKTEDVFLTSFKGLRDDGRYRRRIDFYTIKNILNKVYSETILTSG